MADNEARIAALEKIIRDTLWMACRYAHGRQSYSVAMYNEAARQAVHLNVVPAVNRNGEPAFAIDGSYSRGMSGLTLAEYDAAMTGWFRNDAIPNHCRADWLRRDSDRNPEGEDAVAASSRSDESAGTKCIAQTNPGDPS